MAAGFIRGVQEQGVAACAKHFAANSQEMLRMSSDSVMDERTLREMYLTNFEIAVKEEKPRAIMTSYNRLNGTYTNENQHLLKDILRGEWDWQGLVVTDWGGSNSYVEGVRAGMNLEMPAAGDDSACQLLKAVKEGRITEKSACPNCWTWCCLCRRVTALRWTWSSSIRTRWKRLKSPSCC